MTDGDYIKDGLVYCGKCNTPKQTRVKFGRELKTVGCLCKCREEEIAEEEKQRKAEQKRQRIEFNRKDCFFGSKGLINCTFETDDNANEKASAVAKRYVENFKTMYEDGKGLIFFGLPERGKSFLASCIANALIDKCYRVKLTSFPRLLKEIQETFEGQRAIIDGLNDYDLLIIDDLGIERDSSYMDEIVELVIDNRYVMKLPLIVTTNLTGQELTNPKGISKKRTYSRILEMCLPVEVQGNPRRQIKRVQDFKKYKDLLQL